MSFYVFFNWIETYKDNSSFIRHKENLNRNILGLGKAIKKA